MKSKDYYENIVANLEDIADDLLDSNDYQTSMRIRRIASNIAVAVSDIEPTPVENNVQTAASLVKDAVSKRKTDKKSKLPKIKK